MVSSGHPLASLAGIEVLKKGGNAIDAGVAMGLCINVTIPNFTNFGGVAPIMIYSKSEDKVFTLSAKPDERGLLMGGAEPRRECYAIGY